jgi:hypothetical protein
MATPFETIVWPRITPWLANTDAVLRHTKPGTVTALTVAVAGWFYCWVEPEGLPRRFADLESENVSALISIAQLKLRSVRSTFAE